MPNPHDVLSPTVLDYESWRDLLCSMCGRYYSESIEPNAFAGWVRPVTARGFTALDIGCNAHQVERTYRDVRLAGADHYFPLFQASGQLAMFHNDQAVRLAVGDVALVDAARPVTYCADNGSEPIEGTNWGRTICTKYKNGTGARPCALSCCVCGHAIRQCP